MIKKATDNSEPFTVIEGIRYKKGSVKILEQNEKYFVIMKRYLIWDLSLSKKTFEYTNLIDAESRYEELKHHLYLISR